MTITAQDMGFGPAERRPAPSGVVGTAMASEEARIKAQIVMALEHPRNQAAAVQDVLNACTRVGLAREAIYEFKRGKENVRGPSVDLARAIAVLWTHVDSGYTIVADSDESRLIRCYAHDLCTGRRVTADQQFRKAIQRKDYQTGVTTWSLTDDQRLIREETAKWAAIGERNCILQIVPRDVVDAALAECNKTLNKASAGELEANRDDTLRSLVAKFNRLSVTVEMLEKYLEHPLAEIDAAELGHLQRVGKSIADGNATRDEFFHFSDVKSPTHRAAGPLDALQGGQPVVLGQDGTGLEPAAEEWEPDASKPMDSKRQGTLIQKARDSKELSQEAMQKWRRSVGLKKGDKINQVQAAALIDMIGDGSIAQFEEDGIR